MQIVRDLWIPVFFFFNGMSPTNYSLQGYENSSEEEVDILQGAEEMEDTKETETHRVKKCAQSLQSFLSDSVPALTEVNTDCRM